MKRLYIFVLALSLLFTLCGCKNDPIEPSVPDRSEELLNNTFSATPFLDLEEGDVSPTEDMIRSWISKIPSDKYEAYPSLQNIPLSAMLYKDGEAVSIDIADPRLIRLVNFFNNALYNEKCSYIQSFLSDEYLEERVINEEFRLEIKYKPYGTEAPSPYETAPTNFDTIIIINSNFYFTLINHDIPIRSNDEILHPYLAAGYSPFFSLDGNTLEIFGF
ncbi:MAG: hypothetical protein E7679_07060 [Ruminococcaceae bacterium]|nr:hypothetical protein [Oscillospiraceae bacterium]